MKKDGQKTKRRCTIRKREKKKEGKKEKKKNGKQEKKKKGKQEKKKKKKNKTEEKKKKKRKKRKIADREIKGRELRDNRGINFASLYTIIKNKMDNIF